MVSSRRWGSYRRLATLGLGYCLKRNNFATRYFNSQPKRRLAYRHGDGLLCRYGSAKPIAIDANIEIVSTKPATKTETAPKAEKVAKAKPAAKKPVAKAVKKPAAAPAGEMQMVETKSMAKPAVAVADSAKAPRKAPNWKKDAETKGADAPLVMVETQNK